MTDDATIQALRRERAGLVARGEKDRVAQVDAELERLGDTGDVEAAVETAPEKAVTTPARKRSAKPSR
jgi:hypothetical protein